MNTLEANEQEARAVERVTEYVNPSTREVMAWIAVGLCAFCGGKCSSGGCRLRYCDCCSQWWIADTEADWDFGHPEAKEDCPPCKQWLATMHLDNPAASFQEATA